MMWAAFVQALRAGVIRPILACALAALCPGQAVAAAPDPALHLGVASCAGSTCHGRQEATGPRVRQNELISWQDPASLTGAHSRAWTVLKGARAQAIGQRLGIADVSRSGECINCHGDPAPRRSPQWQQSDGVGCEACHGGGERWLASHAAVGATHADNVARGMWALNDPAVRAGVCLDCHWGSANPGQFVSHRIMAAGHPRLVFELDLFTSLQGHHDEDADYRARKSRAGGVKLWAVGQALATERALSLWPRAANAAMPDFSFFDCRSCHRTFSDDPAVPLVARTNAARPIPPGTPVWNDENLLMLDAAARVVAPRIAARHSAQLRAFHAAVGQDRAAGLKAAAALRGTAAELARAFAAASFSRAETLAMLNMVLIGNAGAYTDYQGGAQAVMAAETLLAALVADHGLDRAQVAAMRPVIDLAYAQARDANRWQPAAFRASLAEIAGRVAALQ